MLTSFGQCAFQTLSPPGRCYTYTSYEYHNTLREISSPADTRHIRWYESPPVPYEQRSGRSKVLSGYTAHVLPIHREHLARLPLVQTPVRAPRSNFGSVTTTTSINTTSRADLRTTVLSIFIHFAGTEQLLRPESHSTTAILRRSHPTEMDSAQVNGLSAARYPAAQDDGNEAALDQIVSIGMLANRFVINVTVRRLFSFYQHLSTWRIAAFHFQCNH
jgi:hypothetical protein